MAPHSSTLAWRVPWTEEPGRLQSMGLRRVGHDWLSDFTFTFHFHALEKEMAAHSSTLDWRIPGTGAWWAAVYGVTQSWTRLTWLSSSSNLLAKKPNAGLGCVIECWRIDAFELWCWKRLLRARWTARRSNQSILKEISPECSLEGLMLKLKLQYFGHLMQRIDSLEKILMLGKIEGGRKGRQRMRCWMASPTEWTWVWVNSRSWWWTGRRGMLQSIGSQRVRHDWATELNWTDCQGMSGSKGLIPEILASQPTIFEHCVFFRAHNLRRKVKTQITFKAGCGVYLWGVTIALEKQWEVLEILKKKKFWEDLVVT